MNLDYYQILGLARSASMSQIKAAFKSKSQKMHPDKGGSEEAYSKVRKAFTVLSDPQKRAIYDRGLEGNYNYQELQMIIDGNLNRLVKETIQAYVNIPPQACAYSLIEVFKAQTASSKQKAQQQLNELKKVEKKLIKGIGKIKNKKDGIIFKGFAANLSEVTQGIHGYKLALAALDIIEGESEGFDLESEEGTPQLQIQGFGAFFTNSTGGTRI